MLQDDREVLLKVRSLIPRDRPRLYGPNGICFDVRVGDFLVVVGKSGSGKSTLLELILGTRETVSGTIELFRHGRHPLVLRYGRDFAEREFGIIFQDYGLFGGKTIQDNLEFALRAHQIPPAEWSRKITSVMEELELTRKVDLKSEVDRLSGGEKQRVALARLLLVDRTVYLFDEPLSNIDSPLRQSLLRHFLALKKDLYKKGAAAIYVTHSYAEAMSLATSVMVIGEGDGIEQIGSPQCMYEFPKSRFVAEFLGDAGYNFVPVAPLLEGRGSLFPGPTSAIVSNSHTGLPLGIEEIDGMVGESKYRSHDGYKQGYWLGFRPECLVPFDRVDRSKAYMCFDVAPKETLYRGKDSLVIGKQDERLGVELRWICTRDEVGAGEGLRGVTLDDCRVFVCATYKEDNHICTDVCNWENITKAGLGCE